MKLKRQNVYQSFVDLLFNALISFFILFLLAILMVNPKAKNKDIELKAEYVITLEWDSDSRDDVDLLMLTPDGKVVFYGAKDGKFVSLDRDDVGSATDILWTSDGKKINFRENWEHMFIRKIVPGRYVVTVNMYDKRDPKPVRVSVKIEALNPYRLVWVKTIKMEYTFQEENIAVFEVSERGSIKSISSEPVFIKHLIKPPQGGQ